MWKLQMPIDTGMMFWPPLVDNTNLSSMSAINAVLKYSLLEYVKRKSSFVFVCEIGQLLNADHYIQSFHIHWGI